MNASIKFSLRLVSTVLVLVGVLTAMRYWDRWDKERNADVYLQDCLRTCKQRFSR